MELLKQNAKHSALLEIVLSNKNLNVAYERVKANKGAPGVDGVTVDMLSNYLCENKEKLIDEINTRTYKPSPVKRVEIPKPDGGVRKLGIPTTFDRLIQQAIMQVLSPIYEKQFNDNSFGFRPKRSAKDAIELCKQNIDEGYKYVVDIDLEKFFDKVNHDRLMTTINNTIKDSDLLSLIRKYLVSGVMVNGVVISNDEGTPQGGPLSPLLSNIVLNELDNELTKRGHKFVRYADDVLIFVKTERSANRVMERITDFIERKLRLKVNQTKSRVVPYTKIKYLGFGFYQNGECTRSTSTPKVEITFKGKDTKTN